MRELRFWTSYRDRSPGFWMKWLGLDGNRYRLVWDAARPDYLIATPHIYTSDAVRNEFSRLYGDSAVAQEFNGRAFVNANGLSAEELIDRVRELDTDDAKYCAMLSEPPMTAEQCRASGPGAAHVKRSAGKVL